MQVLANVAEIWVFSRTANGPRYLILESSQEKVEAFFGADPIFGSPTKVATTSRVSPISGSSLPSTPS